MNRIMTTFAMAATLVVGIGYCSTTQAEDTKTESKATTMVSPSSINFPAEFGLGFDSLKDLGARIGRAQDSRDPVALILLGKELSILEQVSGKKVAIKAEDLTKDGLDSARLRHRPAELKAVALLLVDDKLKQELSDLAKAVENNKERPRGIPGNLIVHNGHRDYVHIYINGENVGHVAPGATRFFQVGDDRFNDTTQIFAHDTVKAHNWGPHGIVAPNSGNNHHWNLK